METEMFTVRKLDTGYYHIRGLGICNWAQPPHWPCHEDTLRASAFPEASEDFLRSVVRAANVMLEANHVDH